jgi:hypothetical protein
MNKDYLWDKTGEEAEIERLENALKVFRYQESAPPELPAKVFELEKPRRFFQFGFAFASFASVVVLLFAIWFQVSSSKINGIEGIAKINQSQTAGKIISNEPEIVPVKTVDIPKRFNKPNVVKIRQTVAPVNRVNQFAARNSKAKAPTETLTAEEKYAYDQLMLALSITSSKLKIVKDKVDGIEEKTAVLDTAK